MCSTWGQLASWKPIATMFDSWQQWVVHQGRRRVRAGLDLLHKWWSNGLWGPGGEAWRFCSVWAVSLCLMKMLKRNDIAGKRWEKIFWWSPKSMPQWGVAPPESFLTFCRVTKFQFCSRTASWRLHFPAPLAAWYGPVTTLSSVQGEWATATSFV